ncbi:MAG: efflux RND transporter periplasmic adaptor subunit, partial [Chloroflexi bacterium]|nr:efflux RND transporter periplasmic adaptor subunit [Chloroflexota bacterium]
LVAQANLAATKANPTAEDIAVAQAQVAEAEAVLAKVQVQLDKLTLAAPRAGLISHKLVNPGELAAPGTVLLELSDIDAVDLIVYIPETLIGQVKVGQEAQVFVDAYPGEIFEGVVTFIKPEAEFTPRNVQTREERVNLVFAVKITLDNPDHRLKPGMPADAEILPQLPPKLVEAPSQTVQTEVTATPTATSLPTRTPTVAPTSVSAPTTPAQSAAVPTEVKATAQAEIITWGLKVRTGPGVNYPVVAHLAQGAVVPVIEEDAESRWLQVQLPRGEETGWISNNPAYVRVTD